jgi:hypothetical protein
VADRSRRRLDDQEIALLLQHCNHLQVGAPAQWAQELANLARRLVERQDLLAELNGERREAARLGRFAELIANERGREDADAMVDETLAADGWEPWPQMRDWGS